MLFFFFLSCVESLILFLFLENFLSWNHYKTFQNFKVNWTINNKYWHQKIQLAFIFLLAVQIVHSAIDRFHIVSLSSLFPAEILCMFSVCGWQKYRSKNQWLLISFVRRTDGPFYLILQYVYIPFVFLPRLEGELFNYTWLIFAGFKKSSWETLITKILLLASRAL
jgi:hypothetical protein